MTEYIIRFTDVDGTSFNSRFTGEDREDALAWIRDKLNSHKYLVKGIISEVIFQAEPITVEPERTSEPTILWDCEVPEGMPVYYGIKWRLALLCRTHCITQEEYESQLKAHIRNNLKTSSLVTRRHKTKAAKEYQKFLNANAGRGSFDRIAFKKNGGVKTTFIDSLVTKRREALIFKD